MFMRILHNRLREYMDEEEGMQTTMAKFTRGSWRGKMGTGISLIVDWENGIYSLGPGFSHWEWDEQL